MKSSPLSTKLISAFLLLAVVVYFGVQTWQYFVDPETTTPVYVYRAEKTLTLDGFVVRDEEVVACSETLLELSHAEGERVAKGKPLATVYRSAQALSDAQLLAALREQLEQLQYAQTASLDTEAALRLDTDIENNMVAVRAAFAGGKYADLEADVSSLKATIVRREYAYRAPSDLSGRIRELESQIASLSGSVGSAARVIAAPFAGTYSAVTDGYESVLTPDALKALTPSQLEAAAPSGASSTVGKLIRGSRWYYAAPVEASVARSFTEGQAFELAFSGVDFALPVTVSSVGDEENGRCLVIFQSSRFLSAVTMLRTQSAELILESYTGLRIPKNALRIAEDGGLGVYCLIGRQAYFKPVELIYQGEDYCLVQPGAIDAARDSDLVLYTLRANDEVIVTATTLFNGKVVE